MTRSATADVKIELTQVRIVLTVDGASGWPVPSPFDHHLDEALHFTLTDRGDGTVSDPGIDVPT